MLMIHALEKNSSYYSKKIPKIKKNSSYYSKKIPPIID